MTVNYGSRRILKKIGMRHTKTVPIDAGELPGGEYREAWYKLTRREWADKQDLSNNGTDHYQDNSQ